MTEAAKEAKRLYQREYNRKWRERNRERLKAYRDSYWERKGAELLEKRKTERECGGA